MPSIVTSADGELAHIRPPRGFGLSAREDYLPDGTFRATQVYTVDWADRDQVILEAAAAPYPHKPATNAWLYAANIRGYARSSTEDGTPTGLLTYTKAMVTLIFWNGGPVNKGGKFVTEELRGFNEMLPVPPDNLRVGSTTGRPPPPNTTLRKPVAGLKYIVTFHHVLAPPDSIVALKNYINVNVFRTLTLELSFAPETVWYRDCFVTRTIALGGGPDFKVELEYAIRPESWNKHWFANYNPPWQYLYTSTGQVLFHPLGHINLL